MFSATAEERSKDQNSSLRLTQEWRRMGWKVETLEMNGSGNSLPSNHDHFHSTMTRLSLLPGLTAYFCEEQNDAVRFEDETEADGICFLPQLKKDRKIKIHPSPLPFSALSQSCARKEAIWRHRSKGYG